MHNKRAVVITGIGLVSSLGEGVEAHWRAVTDGRKPMLDNVSFAPYSVHPLIDVDWSQQIPKRSDQRQMETWQRLGTYTAGLALEDAQLKDNGELLSHMDKIIAAGGGERDVDVDVQIMKKGRETSNRGVMLNQTLATELRPTLFLAQLSNLLAGNISIVHKVTGSSLSFMGEEAAGLSAFDVAIARINSGQSTHVLVGGAYNAQHYDMLLGHELDGLLQWQEWCPVWQRLQADGGGLITGTAGAFLVLEEAEHAQRRNAKIYAEIETFVTDQINRSNVDLSRSLDTLLERVNIREGDFVVSSASGADHVTQMEQAALIRSKANYRAICSLFGHLREAQFPFSVAIGALALKHNRAFPALSSDEPAYNGKVDSMVVSAVGIKRGEGVVRLKAS